MTQYLRQLTKRQDFPFLILKQTGFGEQIIQPHDVHEKDLSKVQVAFDEHEQFVPIVIAANCERYIKHDIEIPVQLRRQAKNLIYCVKNAL